MCLRSLNFGLSEEALAGLDSDTGLTIRFSSRESQFHLISLYKYRIFIWCFTYIPAKYIYLLRTYIHTYHSAISPPDPLPFIPGLPPGELDSQSHELQRLRIFKLVKHLGSYWEGRIEGSLEQILGLLTWIRYLRLCKISCWTLFYVRLRTVVQRYRLRFEIEIVI